MRKSILAAFAAAAVIGALAAPQAQAQSKYPSVTGVTPFSAEANFMSKPGYLRYRYFVSSGEWLSYTDAARIVAEQGG